MKLNNVKPAKGAVKSTKRIGRGQGSGHGGTSTRGHKGQKSRSGYSKKIGFEGGQMPLQRRVPKFGFKNLNRVEYKGVNLDTLSELVANKKLKEVTVADIKENGLAGKHDLVKILGRGEFTAKVKVSAHAFTKTAQAGIESAGGTVEVVAK
ncbi:MAG: 50S ribosomal protein L15 [Crocinitomicaceae bacterium]|nr:50S ribosomal protein L15 [Crocinitomicaceae bacterium]